MIRTATNSDAFTVTLLALLLWPDHQFDELKDELEGIISDNNAIIAICFDNKKPIGFAQCQLRFDYVEGTKSSPVGYLEGIFVEQAHRNQSVAKNLLRYCEAWAKERGCSEFASDCKLTNADSLNFHLKVGFTEVNRIICFKKELGENTPRLETKRLILRRFTAQDAGDLLLILSDREVNTFLPWFPLETLAEAEEFLQNRFLEHYLLPTSYRYAICLKTDNRPIGYVNISDDASHDFGYGLRMDFWHKGIVTEAGRAVLERLKSADYPFITATHDVNNPRSGAVMQKLGMTYRYSYEELVQPKNTPVTFRMYQLNISSPADFIYKEYWNIHPIHCVEKDAF